MSGLQSEPDIDRRKLSRSPLVNAIWQLKFTSDVSLASGRPAIAFQSALNRDTTLAPIQAENIALRVSMGLAGGEASTSDQAWRISSADGSSHVTLQPGVATFETSVSGAGEENFESWIADITRAVGVAFDPGLSTRVGLRFVNVIFGKALDRDAFRNLRDFRGVVDDSLLSFAAGEQARIDVEMVQGRQVLSLREARVNLNYTLVLSETGEAGMLIDIDNYLEQTHPFDEESVHRTSSDLHDAGLTIFQRCITPDAWEAMGPVDARRQQ